MTIRTEIHRINPDNWLILTKGAYQRASSYQWIRAILWQDRICPYEGKATTEPHTFLLFVPENENECLLCLKEALLLQGGRDEIEWAYVAIVASQWGISDKNVLEFFSSHIPLLSQSPTFWTWMKNHVHLIAKAVQYGVSLRLLYDWKDDEEWMTWLTSAIDFLCANGNQLRQIRQGFLSLKNGKNWSLQKILEEVEWETIQTLPEGPSKRLEILMMRLKTLRYPLFTMSEGKLLFLATAIKKKTGWKLTWPDFLEGDSLFLSIPVKEKSDLFSLEEKRKCIEKEIEEALSILRGDKK
ncbi:MAG: hypothetical protein ACK4HQ_09070 [Brevinematales bacterium]